MDKRFIFFFKKDSRLGLRHFVPDPNLIAQEPKQKTFESRVEPNFSPTKNENVKVSTAPIRSKLKNLNF